MIYIIDYNAGNLTSVVNAFKFLGADCRITDNPADVDRADGVVLPGVGAFGWAMDALRSRNLVDALKSYIKRDKPFLGICLGMQLLFEGSQESEGVEGFGVFPGIISKLAVFNDLSNINKNQKLKIPHIGWNSVDIIQNNGIFKDVPNNEYFYFVHSYCAHVVDPKTSACKTEYGEIFDSAVQIGNVAATQFHPEKSGDAGMKILKNFIDICLHNVNKNKFK